MLRKKHEDQAHGAGGPDASEFALLQPLLAVHSAPNVDWLADAAGTAAERGLGALYGLLYLLDESGRRIAGRRPATSDRVRHLARLHQTFETDLTAVSFEPDERPVLAAALHEGRIVDTTDLLEVLPLPLDADGVQLAQRRLSVGRIWVAPLWWRGVSQGFLLLLMPSEAPEARAHAELLGSHVAVALTNLREEEMGRKQGELDATRWIYDERRFLEQLAQEMRRHERHHRPLSIMFIRVVNLAELYERYGRFLTERLLRQIAGRLTDAMRDTDFLGAFRADGFAMILVEADEAGAQQARVRLLEGLDTRSLPHAELPDLQIVVAGATATMPEDGETAEDLSATAEQRLAEAAAESEQAA
jgi:diguanylate cyclase (GGDEF)-like protein